MAESPDAAAHWGVDALNGSIFYNERVVSVYVFWETLTMRSVASPGTVNAYDRR